MSNDTDWAAVSRLAVAMCDASVASYADGEWSPGIGERAAERLRADVDGAREALASGSMLRIRTALAALMP